MLPLSVSEAEMAARQVLPNLVEHWNILIGYQPVR